jgi:hypothetical protein
MDFVLPLGQTPLGWEKDALVELTVPLSATGAEETRQSSLPNQIIQFALFRAGTSGSCSFRVRIFFSWGPVLISKRRFHLDNFPLIYSTTSSLGFIVDVSCTNPSVPSGQFSFNLFHYFLSGSC